ncbi:MAG: hypothetical protein ABSD72_06710 [Terracidiphilus sp.]
MKFTNHKWFGAGRWMGLLSLVVCVMGILPGTTAGAQAISTTTVQGTVYLANGQPGTGTLVVSWPTFTTASGQLVAADSTTVPIAPDGFVSVNLAANVGASPAGLYYTAVYYMSDGSTNTQYWVVPAGAQAALGQVQAQLMPATQAVQAVNKAYVDQAIAGLSESLLTASGGTMIGPLTLCCDPTQPMQAADKHYVDEQSALAVPLTGATMTGPLTSVQLGALYQVDQFAGADFGAKLGACLSGLSQTNGGTCDARNFTGTLAMGSNLTISTGNATVLLPCATISTGNQIIVAAGTRNVSLHGCASRGTSTASGSQGGTVFLYSGSAALVQVGDPTYAADTQGFRLDNVAINITSSTSASAQGLTAYRTQEMDLESLYFLGNSNQTGMTLDGTGNYTGGTFLDVEFGGFQTAVNAIGHQISNPATTDWMNASTFLRLHIDCPTSGGSPISWSYGINLQQGDGNTFTGGDIEGCATALHLGANAQNNTIVGLRNENSTNQIVADAGSSYNSWITGGTMFTGQLTDNGTRNSFLDTFHRSFNALNGDWYGSQADATLTNHYRLGIGAGNERGLLNEIQTDYGYRWLEGYSDATAGEQFYQIDDLLNNVNRLSIGQYNSGQLSTNNQTAINAAGTGAVVLNGSTNAGTGGVVIGSGGANESTVATISSAGNAQFNGSLQVGGASTLAGSATVKNQGNAEIDYILQAGATASQKESLIYNDWNGNSQWYMVKNATNDWALNSATGGLDSFMAYQSTNSGDTYVNASNSTGVVRINYETGAGTGFKVYGGNSSTLYASFTGTTAIQFPGLAASSGHNCLQVDNSGYISNTGTACGTGTGATLSTIIPGATVSGTGSSQTVIFPGTVEAGAVMGNVNGVFSPTTYTSAATSTVTAADLAFSAAVAYMAANSTGAVLDLGPYPWKFCNNGQGWILPTETWGPGLSIRGVAKNLSNMTLSCRINRTALPTGTTGTLSQAAIWQPSTTSSGSAAFHFADFSVDAAYLASSALDLTGNTYSSSIDHVSFGDASGDGTATSHVVQIGNSNSSLGWAFQTFLSDVGVANQMFSSLGSGASLSVSLSSGVPTVSVTGGGTGYSAAGTIAWLQGYGAGSTPCTSMGTLTPTVVSGAITAVSASGFSGCVGTVEALAYDAGANTNYGIYFANWTDSTATNLQASGGKITPILSSGGGDTFVGAHPCCGAPANIIENGKNTWFGTNMDSPGGFGFQLGPNAHPFISGTMHYWNGNYAGSSDYFIPLSASAVLVGDTYNGTQAAGDYHQIVVSSGALDHIGAGPQGTIPTGLTSLENLTGQPNDYNGYSYLAGSVTLNSVSASSGMFSQSFSAPAIQFAGTVYGSTNAYVGGIPPATATGTQNNTDGLSDLMNLTTGSYNDASGAGSLQQCTACSYNSAHGVNSLLNLTSGSQNTANGYQAGTFIAGNSPNQTSTYSLYEGYQAKAKANGDTNEIVIGASAQGNGSNTATIGNASVTDVYLPPNIHGTSFTGNAATASAATTATTATTATSFTGSLTGDVTGTQSGTTVTKINGGALPVSTKALATNSSGQITAASNTLGCLDGYDHLPCTVYATSLTGQTATIASTAVFTPTATNGTYQIAVTATVASAATSGSIQVGANVHSVSGVNTSAVGSSVSATSAGANSTLTAAFHGISGATWAYYVNYGTGGSYLADVVITRLQ